MPDLEPISFSEFQKHVGLITHLDPQSLSMETNFVLDLGLDSLKLLQLVLGFEKIGVRTSLADAWAIQTVGDAYQYYLKSIASQEIDQG